MTWSRKAVGIFCFLLLVLHAAPQTKAKILKVTSGDRRVNYEELSTGLETGTIVLLPGASGPGDRYYREQADLLFRQGFTVDILHYYDAADSHTPAAATYRAWINSVIALVHELQSQHALRPSSIAIVGDSLGASIALAAGSENLAVAGIVEWSGDLPDAFYKKLQGMPPLLILHGAKDRNIPVSNAYQLISLCHARSFQCESKIYPSEEHIFGKKALQQAQQSMITFLHQVLH